MPSLNVNFQVLIFRFNSKIHHFYYLITIKYNFLMIILTAIIQLSILAINFLVDRVFIIMFIFTDFFEYFPVLINSINFLNFNFILYFFY